MGTASLVNLMGIYDAVQDFKIRNDGTPGDNVYRLRDALAYLGALPYKAKLYFRPGLYLWNKMLVDGSNGYLIGLVSGVSFEGAGRGATEFRCGVANANILYGPSITDVSIKGIKLNGAGVSDNGDGMKLLSCSRLNISDVEVLAARIGFQLLGCTDVSLLACHARNQVRDTALDDARGFSIGDQLTYTGTARVQLANCLASSSADHGFAVFTNASDVQMANCHALSCAGVGFRISDSLAELINCFARANSVGFDVINSSSSRIEGHAIGNGQYGLRVLGTQMARFHLTCRDNGVSAANTYSGIYVDDYLATASILNTFECISRNTGATGQKYGYESAGNSGYNTIAGNYHNNQTGGIKRAATDIVRPSVGYDTTGRRAFGVLRVAVAVADTETVTIGADVYEFDTHSTATITAGRIRVDVSAGSTVKARGTLSAPVQPAAGETITLGSTTYTFVASGAVAGQINLGVNVAATQANIVAAINGTDGVNAAHSLVSAAAFAANNCVITALAGGTAGNAIASTETMAGAGNQFDAATLGTTTAGVDPPASEATTALTTAINASTTQAVSATRVDANTVMVAANETGAVALSTTETMAGAGNAWDAAAMSGGAATDSTRLSSGTRVPTAAEVTAGKVVIPLDFGPVAVTRTLIVTATGAAKAWDGAAIITAASGGSPAYVTLNNSGATDWAVTDTIHYVITD